MSNTTITNLTAATTVNGTEQIPAVQSGTTVRITSGQISTYTINQFLNSIVQVPNGGTGQVSFTSYGVLYGQGTNALGVTGAGATNQVLIASSNAPPSWNYVNLSSNVIGILPPANGGTGVANSSTITLGGNLTVSGAYPTTLSVSASTSVSLPASGYLISTVNNMAANPVTGTPTSSNFLRGDGTWAVPAGSATSITIGTTTVLSGTSSYILYNNAGVLGNIAAVPIANGGTGQTTASAGFNALSPITSTGDLIIGNGSNSATRLAIGSNGYVLTSNGTTATWAASTGGVTSFSAGTTGFTPNSATTGAITLSGTLSAANGGTGVNNGTSTITIAGNVTHAGAFTQTFTATGNTSVTLPTSGTLVNTAVTTLSSLVSIGTVTTGVWNATTIATGYGGTGLTTFTAANNAIYSTSSSALTAGTLPVAAGGTGSSSLTANNVLLGNGTSALQVVAPGTSGNVLTSNGTTWVSSTPAASGPSKAQAIAYSMILGF